MLKIKEDRLDELEKFGFELMKNAFYEKYVNIENDYVGYFVDCDSRCISINTLSDSSKINIDIDYELELLYDLIKADMIEKEE